MPTEKIVPKRLVKTNAPWMPTKKIFRKTPPEKAIHEQFRDTVVPETPSDTVENISVANNNLFFLNYHRIRQIKSTIISRRHQRI